MRRFAAKGIVIGLLWMVVAFLFKTAWTDAVFTLRHFIEIVTGDIEAPVMAQYMVIAIGVVLFLLGMLLGTIPREDGSYIDEEKDKKEK